MKRKKLNKILLFISFLTIMLSTMGFQSSKKQVKNILIFTKTAGYRHKSIDQGVAAIRTLGDKHGFTVFHTEDDSFINPGNLKHYHTVIFLNTTGDILNDEQQMHFERYIQAGGGWVGIHSATDTEYEWPWYGQLAGAYFNGHPRIQDADLIVVDKSHPSTKNLQNIWSRKDEWYNFRYVNPNVNILIKIDEDTYEGGTNGENHPVSWYHSYDGGRAFYTALGHTKESYQEKLFLEHILAGIRWTMGV